MDKGLVSVIMPAYNAEKFIAQAIDSVIKQTYSNWELIIIDDGSTDSTSIIVKEVAKSEKRITYHYQNNGKQGKARNLGIKNSNGKYLAFLDADDLWTEDKLTTQINILEKNSEIDLVFSQGYSLYNNQIEDYNLNVKERWDINDLPNFLHHNQITILSVLAKKEIIEQVNFFSEKIEIQNAEDYHLWLKLLINGNKFKSIANRLFYYRIHTNQSTFENANVELPIFNTCIDIYHFAKRATYKKAIIEKLKWSLFNKNRHTKCLEIICYHLKEKKLNIMAILIKTFFSGEKEIQKKIAFQLISTFG